MLTPAQDASWPLIGLKNTLMPFQWVVSQIGIQISYVQLCKIRVLNFSHR